MKQDPSRKSAWKPIQSAQSAVLQKETQSVGIIATNGVDPGDYETKRSSRLPSPPASSLGRGESPPHFRQSGSPSSVWASRRDTLVPSVIQEEGEDTQQYRSLVTSLSKISSPDTLNKTGDTILTTEEYEKLASNSRSRSKSTSGLFPDDETSRLKPEIYSIWGESHRRSSTGPQQALNKPLSIQPFLWEDVVSTNLSTPNDLNGQNSQEVLNAFRQQQQNGSDSSRRFSVAPSAFYQHPNKDPFSSLDGNRGLFSGRRHSVANPAPFERLQQKREEQTGNFVNAFESLALTLPKDAKEQKETINSYFENTQARRMSWIKAGKNLQSSSLTNSAAIDNQLSAPVPEEEEKWPLIVVEFKAGRTDYFYCPDDLEIKIGDLCIVEADRGKDLGKVIHVGIMNEEELQSYQATHPDSLVDSHNAAGKVIHPKRIFRLAQPSEASLLIGKSQDETKAATVCQLKIRQRKMPMEIVDAEYQWDRRKLTFYFVAEQRIDFRELVRELFKIYKTRIWM